MFLYDGETGFKLVYIYLNLFSGEKVYGVRANKMLKTRMLEKLFVSNEQHKTDYFGQFEQNVSLMINGKIHNNTRIVVRFLI